MKPLCAKLVRNAEKRECATMACTPEVGVLHGKTKRFLAFSNKETPRTNTCCTKDTL